MKGFVMSTEENIKDFINQYEGTAIGTSVKNMYENGMFPYATGIGVSKNMDYILYYFYFPD